MRKAVLDRILGLFVCFRLQFELGGRRDRCISVLLMRRNFESHLEYGLAKFELCINMMFFVFSGL